MNELLQQFLIESRELAEHATDDLLALEHAPRDTELLDSVLRAMHTLKGSAGIVEFFEMEQAVHAAEDALGATRRNLGVPERAAIAQALACLDQVMDWLDTIARTGELPRAADTPRPVQHDWSAAVLERHPDAAPWARAAIRYTPAADCFFQGEDPIAHITALPQLLAFEIQPAQPWPPLAALDPFRCNLVLLALTSAAPERIADHMRGVSGKHDIAALSSPGQRIDRRLPAAARDVLASQLALVGASTSPPFGHLASAAITASNVLRFCGGDADADRLAGIAAMDRADMHAALRAALSGLLAEPPEEKPAAGRAPQPAARSSRTESTPRTLRVPAERVDALVRLTGELTVARNALSHLARLAALQGNSLAPLLKARDAAFGQLTGQLQRAVLTLRVMPLRAVFQRFPRLLREISEELGKAIQLKTIGEDTEADKAVVEALFEPLLHVVRNAADHGVEDPALRARQGKAPTATIEIRAARQGDQVLVEVADDGAGMDVDRIRQTARNRGLATEDVLASMTEEEIIQLAFAPGFSTAGAVTHLSGRGMGMDVVRTVIERLGGRVSIQSQAGKGTTVRFMLPFSVMMTTVMSVQAGGQVFGVPLDSVVEAIRLPRSALSAVGAARAVVIRDQTIPVVDLSQMLGDHDRVPDSTETTLVITSFAGQRCGLEVDKVGEHLDIILKPLDGLLAGTPGISGTTLLGDGRVLLVLDVGEMLQ